MYKFTEYKTVLGNYHCGDFSALGDDSNNNMKQAEYLGFDLEDFAAVIKGFQPDHCEIIINDPENGKGLILYWWKSQAAMRKFKNFINKQFRERAKLLETT